MANENSKILTAEQEQKLRQPIEDYVGKIQEKIDALRLEGTDKVISLQNRIDGVKRDKSLTREDRESRIAKAKNELEKAQAVENGNKAEVSKLIAEAESYIKAHFDQEYYQPVKASCDLERADAKAQYQKKLSELAPFTASYPISEGTKWYLCENGTCHAPQTDFKKLDLF